MGFQIHPLPEEQFKHLFDLTDAELSERNACRMIVEESPGAPCRVSLADAEIGETVILANHTHQPANSPYRASHAVYVRKGAPTAKIGLNEVPEVLQRRLVSLRMFDQTDMMIDADVVEGSVLSAAIEQAFERSNVAYIHLHYAKPGCYAASVTRCG